MSFVITVIAALIGLSIYEAAETAWTRWWAPRRLGAHILKAQPHIRHILEQVDRTDIDCNTLYRQVAKELEQVDTTAAVINMASVMLQLRHYPQMSRAELLEWFDTDSSALTGAADG